MSGDEFPDEIGAVIASGRADITSRVEWAARHPVTGIWCPHGDPHATREQVAAELAKTAHADNPMVSRLVFTGRTDWVDGPSSPPGQDGAQ